MAGGNLAAAQKGAEEKGQTILFVDEAGFYLLPGVVQTYAPVGQTPILWENCNRDHLSVISAISPVGALYFQVQRESFNAVAVISFLTHLLHVVPGKILVIWDGATIHRSKETKAFLANDCSGRLQLERLPGYAPDLNPDEWIWAYLKQVELRNLCARDIPHLDHELRQAFERVITKPHVIKGCFTGAGLV